MNLIIEYAYITSPTVLGNAFSACYLLYYILRKQPAFSLHPKYLTLNVLPAILSLGMPLACSTLLFSITAGVFLSLQWNRKLSQDAM